MRITITEDCRVSTDGISVLVLKEGDTPILPDDLCTIIIDQMKSAKPYKEEEIKKSPNDKSMGAAPQNKGNESKPEETEPEEKPEAPGPAGTILDVEDKKKIKDKMRVSEFSHVFKYSSSEVVTAAMNLNISATHPRSSLSKEEAEKILIYLKNADN